MDVFLTEQEIEREKNLFSPDKLQYKPLDGEAFDIHNFEEQMSDDTNMPQPPSSC